VSTSHLLYQSDTEKGSYGSQNFHRRLNRLNDTAAIDTLSLRLQILLSQRWLLLQHLVHRCALLRASIGCASSRHWPRLFSDTPVQLARGWSARGDSYRIAHRQGPFQRAPHPVNEGVHLIDTVSKQSVLSANDVQQHHHRQSRSRDLDSSRRGFSLWSDLKRCWDSPRARLPLHL